MLFGQFRIMLAWKNVVVARKLKANINEFVAGVSLVVIAIDNWFIHVPKYVK